MVPKFTWSTELLPGFTGFYWILLNSTVFNWVFIEFEWVLLGFTGFYWVLLRCFTWSTEFFFSSSGRPHQWVPLIQRQSTRIETTSYWVLRMNRSFFWDWLGLPWNKPKKKLARLTWFHELFTILCSGRTCQRHLDLDHLLFDWPPTRIANRSKLTVIVKSNKINHNETS